jgi:CRP/FNR family transcriptional regulator, cyclic AMP receptor protein
MGSRAAKTSASAARYETLFRTGRWFSRLDPAVQRALLSDALVRSLRKGEPVFLEGDEPDGIYGVLEGAVRFSRLGEGSREVLLLSMEAPSWFGELGMFDGLPRGFSATAERSTRVAHVPRWAMEALLRDRPEVWRDLGLLLAQQTRLAFEGIELLTTLAPEARLARRLWWMAQGYGDWAQGRSTRELRVKQETLASMLALSRQTTNQLLKELEAAGLIRLAYGGVEILDLQGLAVRARAQTRS